MQKTRKKLIGLLCLAVVAVMTILAYFIPAENASAADSHTDVIRVVVYSQYPSATITSPENESQSVSPITNVKFNYENSETVTFTLNYTDPEGDTHTVDLPNYTPSSLDPEFNYASGSDEFLIDLTSLWFGYGDYTLTIGSYSAIGGATGDSVEFSYLPTIVTQTGASAENNDPEVKVEYDDGVAQIVLQAYDENGNPLFDEPIIVNVPEPYDAGETSLTLPFGSYGAQSGNYEVVPTSYTVDPATGDLVEIPAPRRSFKVSYTQPDAPEVPNTGRFTSASGIARGDLAITGIIIFSCIAGCAIFFASRKKKDYRKNLRNKR